MVRTSNKNAVALFYAATFALSSLFYVLLYQIQSITSNPINRTAGIAFTLLVPAIIGLWFGKQPGFLAGIGGPILLLLIPGQTFMVLYAIIAHSITGYLCGLWKEKSVSTIGSSGLLVGHILVIIVNLTIGELSIATVTTTAFLAGISFEIIAGLFGINMLALIFSELQVMLQKPKRRMSA